MGCEFKMSCVQNRLCVQNQQCLAWAVCSKISRILCYELRVQNKQYADTSCVFKVNRILCWLFHCFKPEWRSEVLSLSTIPHQNKAVYHHSLHEVLSKVPLCLFIAFLKHHAPYCLQHVSYHRTYCIYLHLVLSCIIYHFTLSSI